MTRFCHNLMDKDREKLIELLSDQVIFGLDEQESAELERLKQRFPDWENDSFETAATFISLSKISSGDALPEHLRKKISLQAENYFSSKDNSQNKKKESEVVISGTAPWNYQREIIETKPEKSFGWNWLGWAVAAVAIVALVTNIYFLQNQPEEELVKVPVPTVTPTPTDNERLNELLASNNAIKARFDAMAFENLKGEVVWSNKEQKGYIRISGLPVNDKSKTTYQFWIFDAVQGEKTPVSGGTFNVEKNGDVIIPVDAEVKVTDPKAFAITVEKFGGVVVSKQEKVAGIAKLSI